MMSDQRSREFRIVLSLSEVRFLRQHISGPAAFVEQLHIVDAERSEMSLTPDQADEVIDQLQELVQTEGFDEEYEPTEVGQAAENLIDKLFTR